MPISKRDKKVSLTKTQKKGMPMKQQLVEDIRKFLDKYDNLFVFTINNMRNGPLKDLREEWNDSRFFFAKRKVMALALGRTEADEVQKNIHKLASYLVGQCGLLFTNRPKDQVVQWFHDYSKMEFAKSGFVATETVVLPSGPMEQFSFSLEPHLRSLGLPTQLEKGKIILREDFTVCTKGNKLTPEQASILKLIGKQMAEFKVKIVCMWSKDGSFQRFKVPKLAKPIISESNIELKKKKKKKQSNMSGEKNLEAVAEEEITKLFDQQTISESNSTDCVEMKESMDTIPEENQCKPSPLEEENETMKEKCDVHEEEETSLVSESTKKKKKKATEPDSVEETVSESTKKKKKKATEPDSVEETVSESTKNKKKKATEPDSVEETLHDGTKIVTHDEETEENTNLKSRKKKTKESVSSGGPEENVTLTNESPKITRENPRRSMRTPKPIRRSPEEKTQSVKKLTESNKKTKSAVKEKLTKSGRSTPRKSVSKRIFEEQEDVEMAE